MKEYKHGIYTGRKGVAVPVPTACNTNVTVVIGTAPINTAKDPAAVVNVPIKLESQTDADEYMGFTEEYGKYTIPHATYAAFHAFAVTPIVVINVLDPENTKHVEAVAEKTVQLTAGEGVIDDTGILLDKLVISDGSTEYEADKDYVASFAEDGRVLIAVTSDGQISGAGSVQAAYTKLKPEGVTAEDIIGGISEDGSIRTGMELLDEIYIRYNIVPGQIIAPGFSKDPAVSAALEAKAQLITGLINAMAIVDLDSSSTGASAYTKVQAQKEKACIPSRWNIPVWPMVKVQGIPMWFSAFAAVLIQRKTAANGDIPSEGPDNYELPIDGICLEDGTDVYMTQGNVNDYINAYGVASAIKLPTWRFWGGNTAAYPVSNDPINRWIKCVLMLNYLENKFKMEYMDSVGRSGNYRLVNSIVNEFNTFLNSLTPDHLAGAKILFDKKENPPENIQLGHYKFRTRYADYTPMECIENEFHYDASILESALEGGEES